jgi:hypothetical protein
MDLEQRVVRLEQENRRLKIAGLLTLCVVAAVFVMGQAPPPRNIQAESLSIVDRSGRGVMVLTSAYAPGSDRGSPTLTMYGSSSEVQLNVQVLEPVMNHKMLWSPAPGPNCEGRSGWGRDHKIREVHNRF